MRSKSQNKNLINIFAWFKKQEITYKITFILTSIIIISLFVAAITNWINQTKDINNAFLNLKLETKNDLLSEKNAILLPQMIARFWFNTATFTYLSNTFVVVALIMFLIFNKNILIKQMLFMSNQFITITLIVFWILIFPDSLKNGKYQDIGLLSSILVHLINPLLSLIILFINKKNMQINQKQIWLATIPVLLFYFFALITFFIALDTKNLLEINMQVNINLFKHLNLYIYSFLNFAQPLFYSGSNLALIIFLNILIVIVFFFFIVAIGYFWKWVFKISYKTQKFKNI
ncbi:hypothetical protein VBM87_00585 [Mycoplasma sp. 744]|uniref:MAGa3780 family membrane protein n=1 Tax=Mycoplasma sp. 744 TaxID=3108531 RepID=UPI002B1CFE4A|nr:hypothetical protein [Mycoplasma sp. 744]MEA4115282.1 hypothetical protein [Mycoplasma sp. 744]